MVDCTLILNMIRDQARDFSCIRLSREAETQASDDRADAALEAARGLLVPQSIDVHTPVILSVPFDPNVEGAEHEAVVALLAELPPNAVVVPLPTPRNLCERIDTLASGVRIITQHSVFGTVSDHTPRLIGRADIQYLNGKDCKHNTTRFDPIHNVLYCICGAHKYVGPESELDEWVV